MQHGERERSLQVEVARLTKELRDSREECARLRADFGHEQKIHFSAERAADKLIAEKEQALVAARRECEAIRETATAWVRADAEWRRDPNVPGNSTKRELAASAALRAIAALGAPASAAGEEKA